MDTNESDLLDKINLLFVDDEQQFLKSMTTRLNLRGFHVIAVDRGEKAIEAAGTGHFPSDVEALEADRGKYLGFVRMVARRKEVK